MVTGKSKYKEAILLERYRKDTGDELAELPEFIDPPEKGEEENNRPQVADSQRILKTLNDMAEAGLIKRDLLLTAIVRYKVANHSVLSSLDIWGVIMVTLFCFYVYCVVCTLLV